MPISLAFLVLPTALHGETAQAMPSTSAAKFTNWVDDNRRPIAAFPRRAKEMAPFSREALAIGVSSGALALSGSDLSSDKNLKPGAMRMNGSLGMMVSLSCRLGSRLAQAGQHATICARFGVAPDAVREDRSLRKEGRCSISRFPHLRPKRPDRALQDWQIRDPRDHQLLPRIEEVQHPGRRGARGFLIPQHCTLR